MLLTQINHIKTPVQNIITQQTRLFYPHVYVDASVVIQPRIRTKISVFTAIVIASRRLDTYSTM